MSRRARQRCSAATAESVEAKRMRSEAYASLPMARSHSRRRKAYAMFSRLPDGLSMHAFVEHALPRAPPSPRPRARQASTSCGVRLSSTPSETTAGGSKLYHRPKLKSTTSAVDSTKRSCRASGSWCGTKLSANATVPNGSKQLARVCSSPMSESPTKATVRLRSTGMALQSWAETDKELSSQVEHAYCRR